MITAVTTEYLKQLNRVSSFSLENRVKAVQTIYNRGYSIESHNRALRDIYYLYKSEWTEDKNWLFTQIHDLDLKQPFPNEISQQNKQKLITEIENAKSKTPVNYQEFKQKFIKSSFADLQEYLDWFYLYLPYIVIDDENPTAKVNQDTAIKRLQDDFLSNAPKNTPIEMLQDEAIEYFQCQSFV